MGYPTAARLLEISGYCDKYLAHVERPSILEYGDQTLPLKEGDIKHIAEFLDKYGAIEHLDKYKHRIGQQIYVSDIYEDAGFDHKCLDLSGKNNALPIDLNLWPNPRLDESNFQKFDLVMNFGTTEHVANQLNAFAITHYLSKKNGLILHHIPMLHFSNHAMAVATPLLFQKLINWNNYEILVAQWNSHMLNQAISFHYHARLCYVENFLKIVSESTRSAIGLFVVKNSYGDSFVPPLDVDVAGKSERRLLEKYVDYYAHPLLDGSPQNCIERVFQTPTITEQWISDLDRNTQYQDRQAYIREEVDSTLSIKHREDSVHFFNITDGGKKSQQSSAVRNIKKSITQLKNACGWDRVLKLFKRLLHI